MEEFTEEIVLGGIYKHFKGEDHRYKVIALARDCENPMIIHVIYEQLFDSKEYKTGQVWRRPLEDFSGFKIKEDGSKVKRFTFLYKP